ncbi:hypothetical protein GCM10010365_65360 [Streptomyces poonensis]|uniref:Uncharacterized protein n=1 Tax=Streptomyces poonensis TaxID=68255 RepID=A0A918UV81_9ACTN|nr:hypothetical protein GCM10010365_65360 [Streptomyces poonensis]GLJ89597.1 hypothetical protein GCM10017589_21970 [Streptomyces poonensis]
MGDAQGCQSFPAPAPAPEVTEATTGEAGSAGWPASPVFALVHGRGVYACGVRPFGRTWQVTYMTAVHHADLRVQGGELCGAVLQSPGSALPQVVRMAAAAVP